MFPCGCIYDGTLCFRNPDCPDDAHDQLPRHTVYLTEYPEGHPRQGRNLPPGFDPCDGPSTHWLWGTD